MVEGLSHITFIVRDFDRMEAILTAALDARKIYDSGDATFSLSKERFYLIGCETEAGESQGGIWIAVMEGEPLPTRSYNHVAFRIDEADVQEKLRRLRSLGLDIHEGRPRVEGEGVSIYFYDADNHLFELHTGTLEERLTRYSRLARR
jgi:fosfomycin resistance protein FosX